MPIFPPQMKMRAGAPAPQHAAKRFAAGRAPQHAAKRFAAGLTLLIAFAPLLGGCAQTSPKKPEKVAITFEPIPGQVFLFFQAVALRETESADSGGIFPAPGFRFAGDRVVPADAPDTVAGLELTQEELAAWTDALAKSGQATFYARIPFAVGPNLHSRAGNSTEKRYQANWHIDASAATPQAASVIPETSVDVQPEIIPGTSDTRANVQADLSTADLEPFILSESFIARSVPRTPLGVLLPREAVRRLATSAIVQSGRSLILAHYVRQYRSEPAQNVREHLFFVLSVTRDLSQRPSDLPIVREFPPRYALSLTWNEWDAPAPEPPPSDAPPSGAAKPKPPKTEGDQLRKAAEEMKDSPNAVSQTLSFALTGNAPRTAHDANTTARFEVGENRSFVSGIHRDSDREDSPYSFVISQAWAGMRIEAQLDKAPLSRPVERGRTAGVSAALKGRLADPVRCDDAAGNLPSLVAEAAAKEYHFQIGSQTFADFSASAPFRPGETHLLPLPWRSSGPSAAPAGRERIAFISLKEMPAPVPSAPARP